MMRTITILLSILVTFLPIASFAAEADDLKKQIILDQKKLNVMENMPLTAEESEDFWSVYNRYQEQLFELDVMRSRVLTYYVTNYESLTDQQTINIMDNMFDLADNRQLVMKKFTLELEGVLPIRKVFRYLQVENNIAAIEQYSLVQKIPLLQ